MIYLFECKKCHFKFPYVDNMLQSSDLDLTTIKVLIISSERNWKKELFKKSELKQKLFHENIIVQMGMRVLQTGASLW